MRSPGRYLLYLVLLWPLAGLAQPLPKQKEVPVVGTVQAAMLHDEVGLPFFLEHFDRQDYRQHHQNWAVVQDPRGVVYMANYGGILEYDGARWRLIETETSTTVRSLDVDARGTVYTGVKGDFGYLAPDSTGTLRYVSLRDKIEPADRVFADVWGTHVAGSGVYFQTADRLFRWNGRDMKAWQSKEGFHTSFTVRDQFYVREHGVGLLQVVDDQLQPVPGGRQFADVRIYVMAPYDEQQVLIATREEGLFLYDGASMRPFPTDVDGLLQDYRLYHGCALPDGLFALALLDGGGVLIIDRQGRLVQRLDEETGFPDGWVNYVYPDAQGGLWMALNNSGVARVDVPSALSLYDRRRDLDGRVNSILRHQGKLYVATTTGLFALEPAPAADGEDREYLRFVRILPSTSRFLLTSAEGLLLAATDGGLYAFRGGRPELLTEDDEPVFALLQSHRAGERFYLGKQDGVALLERKADGWKLQPRVAGVEGQIRSMEEEADGTLWVSTTEGQVLRIRFAVDGSSVVEAFGREDGLPEGPINLSTVDEEVVFVSFRGVYRFDHAGAGYTEARFERDTELNTPAEAPSDSLLSFIEADASTFWMVYPDRIDIVRALKDGSYARETPAVLRFPKENVVSVYVEEDGIAWIGNGEELIRYDSHVRKKYDAGFSALVQRVISAGTDTLYGGAPVTAQAGAAAKVLENAHNDLRFEVGAPSFNDVAGNQYQYLLEGRDKAWSPWTHQWIRTYNNLKWRTYTFRVRARNAQGVVSREAAFTFRILPPWYRSWWAYGFYFILLLGFAALFRHYYAVMQENKRAQEQARELARERHINERLQQAYKRLHEANESLKQVNQLKDEFLANTSHELRTPLTAILGFTAVLKEELPEGFFELLDPIESNGQRLLRTVNSLLDIAKLRAGMMEVRREEVNVAEQAADIIRALAPLAQQKRLLLELTSPPQPVHVHLDQRFLERILYNLIGNAIKFTDEGKVSVVVEQQGEYVRVHVRDTGIGIDASFIPHLFDEFKQESTGLARLHEGSGLGLAITARLVKLMDGEIEVQSEKGRGSVFTIIFPVFQPQMEEPSTA